MLHILAVAVAIQIHNLAGAPPLVVRDALREVARVYAEIDVQVDWIDVLAAERDPAAVHVILIGDETGDLRRARHTVLGATVWTTAGTPVVYVFYRRVQAISAKYTSAVSLVFACTLAHELGHVLMPDHAHSSEGLMRATWSREELQRADQGQLHFLPDEAALIRNRLEAVSSTDVMSAFRRTDVVRLKPDTTYESLDPPIEHERRDGARHKLEKHDRR
jgi:hypothetical protein